MYPSQIKEQPTKRKISPRLYEKNNKFFYSPLECIIHDAHKLKQKGWETTLLIPCLILEALYGTSLNYLPAVIKTKFIVVYEIIAYCHWQIVVIHKVSHQLETKILCQNITTLMMKLKMSLYLCSLEILFIFTRNDFINLPYDGLYFGY